MAKKGDQFRILRDISGASPFLSPVTIQAAAALSFGYRPYGDAAPGGQIKAFCDETEIVRDEPVRRVTFVFDAKGKCAPDPWHGPAETVPLAEVWRRLADDRFARAVPGHPLAYVYAAATHLFQLKRKLAAGLQTPRPATRGPNTLDLAPIDTFPGDPLYAQVPEDVCPAPDYPMTFRPIEAEPAIGVKEFFARWDKGWLTANPDHPLTWIWLALERKKALFPRILPPAGSPVGVPMERHQLLRKGRRRLWLPWHLDPAKKRELIALAKIK